MKLILESPLDFRQFQNLIILTFVTMMILLGIMNSADFNSYMIIESVLIALNIMFFAILLTKKGMFVENGNLFIGIFLLGLTLKKTLVSTENFKEIILQKGKLSTNYAYSHDIKDFHNWEPNLNHSESIFTIYMIGENETQKVKILTLTKSEKIKLAIKFITENTNLYY